MEPWSCILQIAICTYLLYLQLGAICCVPILVIIRRFFHTHLLSDQVLTSIPNEVTFVVVALGAGRLPGHQGAWFQAVESRIKLTSHTLSSMQSVKQMGLSREMEAAIQSKRKEELGISQKFRTANIFVMVTCTYLAPIDSPVLSSLTQLFYRSLFPYIPVAAYHIRSVWHHANGFESELHVYIGSSDFSVYPQPHHQSGETTSVHSCRWPAGFRKFC